MPDLGYADDVPGLNPGDNWETNLPPGWRRFPSGDVGPANTPSPYDQGWPTRVPPTGPTPMGTPSNAGGGGAPSIGALAQGGSNALMALARRIPGIGGRIFRSPIGNPIADATSAAAPGIDPIYAGRPSGAFPGGPNETMAGPWSTSGARPFPPTSGWGSNPLGPSLRAGVPIGGQTTIAASNPDQAIADAAARSGYGDTGASTINPAVTRAYPGPDYGPMSQRAPAASVPYPPRRPAPSPAPARAAATAIDPGAYRAAIGNARGAQWVPQGQTTAPPIYRGPLALYQRGS